MKRLIHWSVEHHWLVIALSVVLLAACRHVFAYELPPVFAHTRLLQALAADTLDLEPGWL